MKTLSTTVPRRQCAPLQFKSVNAYPICHQQFQSPLGPYFGPLVSGEGEQAWYLGEDHSFCERARRCGFRVMADATIRLWQVGTYRFGWEDAGRDVQRFGDYTFHITE